MAKRKAGQLAMFNESKSLESKGEKQQLGKAPGKEKEDPMLGKGQDKKAMIGKMMVAKGKEKEMAKPKAMPKPKAKKKAK